MKKFIIVLLLGVILYLQNGEVLEFPGDCFMITPSGDGVLLDVYCSDYKDKGYNHPILLTIHGNEVKHGMLSPNSDIVTNITEIQP